MILSVALAMLAAVSNAVSNVLQRIADSQEPDDSSLSLRMIWSILHRKTWLAGFGAVIASFLLQATALRFGQLAVVQPVIVIELPLTLVIASRVFHASLGRQAWISTAMMTEGLAALIAGLSPHSGNDHSPSTVVWVAGIGVTAAVTLGLVAAGRRRANSARAALFGAATGLTFGLTAAFTKDATTSLSGGLGHLFTSWTLYAMAVSGLAAIFLMQNALQAGSLVAAQPGITLLDPFAAILWGVVGFHEQVQGGPLVAAAVVGAGLVVGGVVLLTRSPLLAQTVGSPDSGADRTGEDSALGRPARPVT